MVVIGHPPFMKSDRLIWIDLEMTGLDPEENVIIEIATIVTDGHLNIIAEGPNLAISSQKKSWTRWMSGILHIIRPTV